MTTYLPVNHTTTTSTSSGNRPERQRFLQRSTCRCIAAQRELEQGSRKSRRRRRSLLELPVIATACDLLPSSNPITPCVVLISEKESSLIWSCRWTSDGVAMQEKRILCYQPSVTVHRVLEQDDHDYGSSPTNSPALTLQEIVAETTHINSEGCFFSLEEVSSKEGACGYMHRHGTLTSNRGQLPAPLDRKSHHLSQSAYVVALSGPPSPLISLTVQIVQCGDTYSSPSALQMASWKRQLCGTIVMFSQAKTFTTTVEMHGLDRKIVRLQITAIGSRSSSSQSLFVVLPSTRITLQDKPVTSIPQNGGPVIRRGMPTCPSGTPRITQILLQTISCVYHNVAVPRTFLLSGPAGVGKTFSVKRVLELCSVPLHFVSLRGSEILQNQASGSQMLEQEFVKAAKIKEKVVIVFLDECDALVSVESAAATLSTVLDKVSNEWTNLLVVGATNRIDSLPEYLRRAGRFDKEIPLSPPNAEERATILTILLAQQEVGGPKCISGKAFASKIQEIAEHCVGYVPADLNALVRKATLLAKQEGPYAAVVNFVEGAMSEVGPSALRDALLAAPPKITWGDIAGDPGGAKTALRQAIEWPRTKAAAFARLGLIPPRGILLHGPPGCAKTTLARAAAGASGVAFLSLSPADVYSSSFVGEAEAVVRKAFSLARSASPCVLFFDEIDAIFGSGQDGGRGSSAEARVLSTFLNEMDGVDNFSESDGVLVLGATNRPWTLDSALVRPGRLGDKVIYIPPPDPAARRAILEMQFPGQSRDMNLDWLSSDGVTGLMTGAELVGACQEAKLAILRSVIQKEKGQSMVGFRLQEHLVSVIRSRKPLLSDPEVLRKSRM